MIAYISNRPWHTLDQLDKTEAIQISYAGCFVRYGEGIVVKIFDPQRPDQFRGYRFNKVVIDEETEISEEILSLIKAACLF